MVLTTVLQITVRVLACKFMQNRQLSVINIFKHTGKCGVCFFALCWSHGTWVMSLSAFRCLITQNTVDVGHSLALTMSSAELTAEHNLGMTLRLCSSGFILLTVHYLVVHEYSAWMCTCTGRKCGKFECVCVTSHPFKIQSQYFCPGL